MQNLSAFITSDIIAQAKRLELLVKRKISSATSGSYRSAFHGSGLEFSELREYQPGDEIRHIHWGATARSSRIYVKSYQEDRSLRVMLAVDISASLSSGTIINDQFRSKHARALEFAALISVLAQSNRDTLGLCLFADKILEFIPSSSGSKISKQLITKLLSSRADYKGTSIDQLCKFLSQHQKKRSAIFIVSDFLSADFESSLKNLSFKHDVILVSIRDDSDYHLPKAGLIELHDSERDSRIIIDSAKSEKLLAEIKNIERQKLIRLAEKTGVDLIELKDNPLKALNQLMRRRVKRLR